MPIIQLQIDSMRATQKSLLSSLNSLTDQMKGSSKSTGLGAGAGLGDVCYCFAFDLTEEKSVSMNFVWRPCKLHVDIGLCACRFVYKFMGYVITYIHASETSVTRLHRCCINPLHVSVSEFG
eukprot:EG_transcript_28578